MISVYTLPFYCTDLEASRIRTLINNEERIELQNRLRKYNSKTKRRKLLKEYHSIKSLCLGLMYGRYCSYNDKFTSGKRVIFPSNHPIQSKLA